MRKAVLLLLALIALGAAVLPGPHPTAANPLTGIVAVAAGRGHTCALTTEGGAKCWGYNLHLPLGDGGMCFFFCYLPVDVVETEANRIVGDVDCSGSVNSLDALYILQRAAHLAELLCFRNAHVDEDGDVTSADAALVLQYEAGLILGQASSQKGGSAMSLTRPHSKPYHSHTGRLSSRREVWHA